MAMRNGNDGVSLSQTAQGALDQINDKLQRIRELTVQGLNGTLSWSDSDSIQGEINMNLWGSIASLSLWITMAYRYWIARAAW